MGLLFRVIYAAHCRSTHHKLAMDALKLLQCDHAERWRDLILKHHDAYLLGAKAPDTRFKDFRNHVLHVSQNHWGGAMKTARLWYHRALETLKNESWINGIYAAGVLSHYYTDPIQPFHTGQSKAENNIHRAAEWSITKSYDALYQAAEENGLPQVAFSEGEDWVEDMVKRGAEFGHPHYQTLIDHYDFDKGRKDPPAGLDQTSQEILTELLGYAVVGWSGILDRLFTESGITPPKVSLAVPAFLATLQIPVQYITKKLMDSRDRAQVQAMYAELQETGQVENTLPEDDRAVRDLFQADWPDAEPPKKPEPKPNSKAEKPPAEPKPKEPVKLRHFLNVADPVEDAPSIGPKTAARLHKVKITTVEELLNADPVQVEQEIDARHITAQVIRDWQDQAQLVCRIPEIRGHDAQILVACGYRDPLDVSTAPANDILSAALDFANTREGQRVIRSGKVPDEKEVADWQSWAEHARELKAA